MASGEHKSDEKVGREVASGDPPSPSAFAEATEGQEATAGPSSLRSLGMTTFRKRRRRGPSRSGGQASLRFVRDDARLKKRRQDASLKAWRYTGFERGVPCGDGEVPPLRSG